MNKDEIIHQSKKIFNDFSEYCLALPNDVLFFQPADKWSAAQNVDHLVRSMKRTHLAYSLPKFITRMFIGKPNRPSKTYDELVAKYKLKLQQGGKASGSFIPSEVRENKLKLINNWTMIVSKYILTLDKKWNDGTLDKYIAPHPLLGKITLRELCYFTIYHTEHHLNIIKTRAGQLTE
jgi:hypothetical protein